MYDSILNDYYKQQSERENRCEKIEEKLTEQYNELRDKEDIILLRNGKYRKTCDTLEEAIEVACMEDGYDNWTLEAQV